ncbi:hypothetical protein [Methylobacterium fujisawaense]|uniref:hypothetical protein n=1 Tax=Methylobacterium fujisawaense TaxID=107400 RepID=UPI00313DE7D2
MPRKQLGRAAAAAADLMTRADVLAVLPRVRTFTGTCGSNGVASISFGASTYSAVPFAWLIEDWTSGGQMICGKVTNTTATGCTVQAMQSVGTLLLNANPFTTAPSGTVVTVAVIG